MRRTDRSGSSGGLGKAAAAAVAMLLLGGCMLGPDYKRPELAVPDQFRSSPPPNAP